MPKSGQVTGFSVVGLVVVVVTVVVGAAVVVVAGGEGVGNILRQASVIMRRKGKIIIVHLAIFLLVSK